MLRIGHGFDVHRFGEGDHLMIGGVRLPFAHGFVAHSDGDVLLHAVCDALLGACALGDIGRHFPDTDPAWAGADSRALLRHVLMLVRDAGYRVAPADATFFLYAATPGGIDDFEFARSLAAEQNQASARDHFRKPS